MGFNLVSTVTSTALSDYNLIDLKTVKDELSIRDGKEDARIKRYIKGASAAIAQYCNRRFQVETIKDEFWPERDWYPYQLPGGLTSLTLSRWPVVAVSSVVENEIALVDGTDFRIDYTRGTLQRFDANGYPKQWPAWLIVVQYTGGYTAIPDDIQDAAIRMIRSRWFARDRDPYAREINVPGVLEEQFWVATGKEAGNMSRDVEDILDNYRVPVLS